MSRDLNLFETRSLMHGARSGTGPRGWQTFERRIFEAFGNSWRIRVVPFRPRHGNSEGGFSATVSTWKT